MLWTIAAILGPILWPIFALQNKARNRSLVSIHMGITFYSTVIAIIHTSYVYRSGVIWTGTSPAHNKYSSWSSRYSDNIVQIFRRKHIRRSRVSVACIQSRISLGRNSFGCTGRGRYGNLVVWPIWPFSVVPCSRYGRGRNGRGRTGRGRYSGRIGLSMYALDVSFHHYHVSMEMCNN